MSVRGRSASTACRDDRSRRAQPDLPWDLADTRYGIAIRTASGDLAGSGPFRLEPADPRRIVLRAHEDYWAGRPFVDAVEIAEGRPFGDELASLELGRADVVAVRPTDLRRLVQRGLRSTSSRPLEVFALVFEPHRAAADDGLVRRAVAASIDRGMLSSVLLQRQAEPAAALLPSWLSGYAPMFQAAPAPAGSRATAVAALSLEQRRLTLRVDQGDPVAQAIAERVAVDAREAGIMIKVQTPVGLAPRPDVRLVRIAFDPTTPDRALARIMTALGARTTALATTEAAPAAGASIETVYRVGARWSSATSSCPSSTCRSSTASATGWNRGTARSSRRPARGTSPTWLRSELIVDKAERPDPRDRR